MGKRRNYFGYPGIGGLLYDIQHKNDPKPSTHHESPKYESTKSNECTIEELVDTCIAIQDLMIKKLNSEPIKDFEDRRSLIKPIKKN